LCTQLVADDVGAAQRCSGEGRRYGLGFWLDATGPGVLLEGSDAGVSFAACPFSDRCTFTVISNVSNESHCRQARTSDCHQSIAIADRPVRRGLAGRVGQPSRVSGAPTAGGRSTSAPSAPTTGPPTRLPRCRGGGRPGAVALTCRQPRPASLLLGRRRRGLAGRPGACAPLLEPGAEHFDAR
jgi:hypothetical protein